MTSVTTLLPTSIALSSDSAIEEILSDIPLFCEGIMGIGVFTFLFLTKQVKLLSIFLYGSSFLAFAAATLDLGQVLARGPKNTANGIGLDTVAGIIYAREVFLSLSFGLLDLFFWKLVACCPRAECVGNSTETSMDRKGRKQLHSASWDRWGLVGMVLKWASLAALLSVPLLQILWRLMPGQRQYGSIYVAETTIQTSLMAIFILKFLLNVSISPNYWWNAFQAHMVPILALSIGVGLGVGNFAVFAFTETTLGRLLRSVEFYLLILHSLYTTFHVFLHLDQGRQNKIVSSNSNTEKFHGNNILPFAYSDSGYKAQYSMNTPLEITRRFDNNSRTSNLSWTQMRGPSPPPVNSIRSQSAEPNNEMTVAPVQSTGNASREGSERSRRMDMAADQRDSRSSYATTAVIVPESPNENRPFTSYYPMEDPPKMETQDFAESRSPNDRTYVEPSNMKEERFGANFKFPVAKAPSISSQQGSVSSIDEILRQQTELDKSIAALRMFSPQADISSQPKSRSTFNSNKTESISNRSDFSLSIFPNPPIVPKNQVATKYSVDYGVPTIDPTVEKTGRKEIAPITISPIETEPQDELTGNFDYAATQYDVTSFIGDLTGPSNNSQMKSPDEYDSSDAYESLTTSIATPGSALALRPMILSSMVITSSSEPTSIPTPPESTYGGENTNLSSPSLRPLFLGKQISSIPQISGTMVPLAQRRQRGGTISAATRRPVISSPRMNQEKTEAAPGAFERPRPPPLRSNS